MPGSKSDPLDPGRPDGGIQADLERLNLPQRDIHPETAPLMLAETRDRPFSDPAWLFELKLDGYRLLAARIGGEARLYSRNGNDLSAGFPEVSSAVAELPVDGLVLDGEVVALNESGRPSFQRLQQRAKLSRALDIRRAVANNPVTFFAFDLLAAKGFDLRALPLSARKLLLRRVLPPAGPIRLLDHFEGNGDLLYQQVLKLGLEGILAKRSDSTYRAGRSAAWLKIRTRRSDDFVVVGWTASKGARSGFGALLLGQYRNGSLTYAGRAGTGFSDKQLIQVRATLEKSRRNGPPCVGPIPPEKGLSWTEPRLVCEVEFTERTDEGLLRQPVFLRFRDDKRPEDCVTAE